MEMFYFHINEIDDIGTDVHPLSAFIHITATDNDIDDNAVIDFKKPKEKGMCFDSLLVATSLIVFPLVSVY